MKNQVSESLTELEGVALALIAQHDGPATAYVVKTYLSSSPSRFWSGSAGSIYPLITRLDRRGLLSASDADTGKRKATAYSLSKAGHDALADWITDIDRAMDPGLDPLRMRLAFLTLVPPARRKTFLESASKELDKSVDSAPFLGGHDDPVNRIHRVWMKARQTAFRGTRTLLDDSQSD